MPKEFAQDYVDVATRIAAFYEKFPDGSLQSQIVELTESRVVVRATAYRSSTDEYPGIGHSAMSIPGSSPFTRGSELENTETSAWGRALAALGFEVRAGVATSDEINAKRPEAPAQGRRQQPKPVTTAVSAAGRSMTLSETLDQLKVAGVHSRDISAKATELFGQWSLKQLSGEQRVAVVDALLRGPVQPDEDDWAEKMP
jgi:hypothetical protein